jgi:deferrochelatase/peroxidase EfeB
MSNSELKGSRRNLLRSLGQTAAVALALPTALAQAASGEAEKDTQQSTSREAEPYFGPYQPGILTEQQAFAIVVAFDVSTDNRSGLERLFKILTERAVALMAGGAMPEVEARFPQPDSGILGRTIHPDGLTITVSVGASLFDDRFGLASLIPAKLKPMERFPNDSLNAAMCHGDILVQFCANSQDAVLHAMRDIIKNTPDLLAPRWKMEGFLTPKPQRSPDESTPRNMLGFKDGTANPSPKDPLLMGQLVWTKGGEGGEPAWTAGGSYQVVRLIRNFVERWDRTSLNDQERFIGRHKYSGAPLGKVHEMDEPDFANSPDQTITPPDAHIRLANPRTHAALATRVLRRGFNYSNGLSKSGQLDMGLLFICYQADIDAGFRAIQTRLNGEPLEEYIKPFGGGYFFALPGVKDQAGYLGQALLS